MIYEASGPQYYEYCTANTGERCLALSNERALIGVYYEHGNASFIGVYVHNMATRLRWVVCTAQVFVSVHSSSYLIPHIVIFVLHSIHAVLVKK